MSHHRFRRFFMARPALKTKSMTPPGFIALPVPPQAVAVNGAPLQELYRWAYETAKAQVEQCHEEQQRSSEWN